MHVDLLINNVCVGDDEPPVDIAIRDGRIVALEAGIDATADEIIDAGGRAAIPGLIEAHLHLDKALLHRRLPARFGTLDEAIRVTGVLKSKQERNDVLDRSRQVLDMAVKNGTVAVRAHPDVDLIQGLIGVETLLELKSEYEDLLDLQIVAFPQEGILKSQGTHELMVEALQMGADVVGGCPYNELNWVDTQRHIDMVFELAQHFDLPVDMHADFADDTTDPRFAAISYIAQKTIETGYQGRVALGHVTSLGALDDEALKPVIERMREAGISIVTLPATDLYLGGRKDTHNQRRGLTPVKALYNAGVNVAYSSNNVRNAFTPFGKADMLQIGNMLAHVAQFGVPEHQQAILDMGTRNAARAIGIEHGYGIAVGKQADLVILDTFRVADALLDIPPRLWVIKRGRITVVTTHHCEIHRHSCCCA
ncbi:amidohydrolase family protein [Paraburkholderia sp. A1RI-2L]|uniref:amidohydrolase family protein n=1 Tax=Paraburkholderia sp. A1RI-2L TaxID=3028367 RepID=UPI003B7955C1